MIKKYLVDNLDKGIHKVKCKFEHGKRCGFCGMSAVLSTQLLRMI